MPSMAWPESRCTETPNSRLEPTQISIVIARLALVVSSIPVIAEKPPNSS